MELSDALAVPAAKAERAREELRTRGILRADLKIRRTGGLVVFPVSRALEPAPQDGRWERGPFEARPVHRSYKEIAAVPEALRAQLPTSFDLVGDLVLIKIPRALARHSRAIGRAIRAAHPSVRAVWADAGVKGPERARKLTRLAGRGPARTVHREYGLRFRVDLQNAYFSPRLAEEHQRVARAARDGERVLDATAGVGPYCIPLAKRCPSSRVLALDINPIAIRLLQSNAAANGVATGIVAQVGDGFAEGARGPWDRIVLNLPKAPARRLDRLAAGLAPGGTLHLTRLLKDGEAASWPRNFARRTRLRLVRQAQIHPYSPDSALYALDLARPAVAPKKTSRVVPKTA